MAVLCGSDLQVEKFYDRRTDPREIHNRIADPQQQVVIAEMLGQLRAERAEIFKLRQSHDDAA